MTKRYDTYKDSGVQWLGEIPGHWNGMRLINCITSSAVGAWGADEKKDGTDILCLRVADFDYDKGVIKEDKLTYRNYEGKLSKEKLFDVGDLLIEKSGGGDIYPVGRVVRYSLSKNAIATCSNFIQKITPNKDVVLSDYLYFWFKMIYSIKINGLYYNQTTGIQNLKLNEYLRQTAYFPPLPEQHVIVSYLDDKCAKIDKMLEGKQKQIELLAEMKQRIIADAVTRGLDPNVKMKATNIPWLKEIPEHWEVESLRKFLRMLTEKGHGDKQLLSVTREQGVIVRNTESKEENHNFIPEDLNGYKYVQVGDFVINKMKSWQGSYGVSEYEGIVSPAYYTCKLYGVDKAFFSTAIRSKIYVSFFGRYSKGIRVDQWDLSPIALKSIPFALPPQAEQRAIVSYITEKTTKIDTLTAKLQQEIESIKEYKQRLISDVVTGQIKVC